MGSLRVGNSLSTMNNSTAFHKYKQQAINNSPELRDLHKRLQTAYNRQVLEAQLANQKNQLLANVIEEKEYNHNCDELRKLEQLRYQKELEIKRDSEEHAAKILQKQIIDKKHKDEEEYQLKCRERDIFERELETERAEHIKIAEKMQEEKKRIREEQLEVLTMRTRSMVEEREKEAEDERKLKMEATRLANYDAQVTAQRQTRILSLEAVKEKLLSQLTLLNRLKQDKNEIALKLQCIEREEREQREFHESERILLRKKQAARVNYDEIVTKKIQEAIQAREENAFYGENLKQVLQSEEERRKSAEKEVRRIRTAVRLDNYKLMAYRREQRAEELRDEKAKAEAALAERDRQDQIIREERIRLLRLIGQDMRKFLPPGTLTEEDLISLNVTI